ncbi:MAG: class I SAM-dependent methyltransferase [Myxococcales bacterium]|nr:class I SAM-dependent methyltransferase [Myxococcales bacterium]
MGKTPDEQIARVVEYYRATNERSYLANWSGRALSFHYGLSDASTRSLDEAHENSNRYLADRLGIGPGSRVLDSGCGVGGTAIWLARERGAKVVGITLDRGQVELGMRFARERGVEDKVQLLEMDYAATTFAPGSFDAALNLESLCHAADTGGYFEHLHGLLAPGGHYGAMEFFVGEGRPELIEDVMQGWAMPAWQSMSAAAEALAAAGFRDVELIDLRAEVRLSAEQMLSMATRTLLDLRKDGARDPVFEGHVKGAIACCRGLLEGGVDYGLVTGRA